MQFAQQGDDFHRPLAVVPVPPAPPSTPAVGADFNSRPKDVIFDGTHLLCSTVFVRDSSYSFLVAESGNHACRLVIDIHKKV